MSEYDSILKEKKKKTPPVVQPQEEKKKKFPTLLLITISLIVLIIISYIIYYNTILSGNKIIENNLLILKENYKNIIDNLNIDKLLSSNTEGSLLIDNTYNYNYIKEEDNYYLKTPTSTKYINNSLNKKFTTKTNLNNINKEKYLKSFYIKNKVPIVEVDLILNKQELEKVLGYKLNYNYEVAINSYNNAITNEIINIKIIINNKTLLKREVITIENNTINYTENLENKNYTLKLTNKNDDFNLKIYKDDKLYSVLVGTKSENSYKYTYQIIDKLYTLNIITSNNEGNFVYELTSNIENINSSLTLTVQDITGSLKETSELNELLPTDKEIYNNELNFLKNFINKHKNNIQ